MRVLVIKPNLYCTAEQCDNLEKKIKPNENGVVVVPSYCDYEFGEIDEIKVENSSNQGE